MAEKHERLLGKGGEKKTESFSQAAGNVIIKHRMIFLAVIGALLVSAIAIGLVNWIGTRSRERGLSAVEDISWAVQKADSLDSAVQKALSDLDAWTGKKGIVGVRANMLKAELLFRDKKYDEARLSWNAAAEAEPKAYTAPLAWLNAGVASEELDDRDGAAGYYQKAAAYADFPLLTRTMFNLGRVLDEAEKYTEAAAQYQKLSDTYGDDPWASLAMSRILALRVEGKIP
ncbi:MAG: hypothetical protein LBS64_04385 [Spirochaetaceae bacterium]|jgi:tetratricopeptide (TPR) repeat protein|nr:hypothetical protein [Spirochaetaceae bacterium]